MPGQLPTQSASCRLCRSETRQMADRLQLRLLLSGPTVLAAMAARRLTLREARERGPALRSEGTRAVGRGSYLAMAAFPTTATRWLWQRVLPVPRTRRRVVSLEL